MMCCQFIFKPGTYDDDFHHLDAQIDEYARGLPGFQRVANYLSPDSNVINAIYNFADKKDVAKLAGSPPTAKPRARSHAGTTGTASSSARSPPPTATTASPPTRPRRAEHEHPPEHPTGRWN